MDVVNYDKAYEQYLRYYRHSNEVKFSYTARQKGRDTFGRMAVIISRGESFPAYYLSRYAQSYASKSCAPGHTLFVSSGSNLPRDMIRNSGYKITRNIDQADYVVIPKPDKVTAYDCFFCGLYADKFYMFYVSDENGDYLEPSIAEANIIADKIKEKFSGIQLIYSAGRKLFVSFLRNVEEHKELFELKGEPANHKYVYDSDLLLTPSTVLSAENLSIIERIPDKRTALKLLMQTDFQKYPFTTCMFLFYGIDADYGYKYGDQVNWMMRTVKLDQFENDEEYPVPIQPEDFALFQSYLMYKLGVADSGGYITDDKLNSINSDCFEFVAHRTAIKPTKINHPMSFDAIKTIISNS